MTPGRQVQRAQSTLSMLVPDMTPTIRRGDFTDGVRIGAGRAGRSTDFTDFTDGGGKGGLQIA
jgi:hypothetical protein